MTKAKSKSTTVKPSPPKAPRITKLELLVQQLDKEQGASLADLVECTGWQAHSVRGAMAGSLKKKGHNITSTVVDGVRRYRAERAVS